jgi:hypothetical protein
MLHRVARGRRKELTDIDKVMTWVNECEEPELEEHYALAHGTLEGEPYPQPCPADGCNAYHGTPAKCLAEKEAEDAEYNRLAAAAELSDKGRDAFNARVLDHAHRHRQVRWNKKGLPLANIPKKRVFVELLHSIFLNAAKLQIKHAWMKYFPDELRDDAHRLFKAWGIPIDMRPPGKRTDQEKWPGGGTVRFLIYGGNGKCPGFAYVTAKLTFMMAEHELKKKLEREADALAAAAAAAKENSAKDKTKAAAKAIGANLFLKPTSKRSKGPSALPLDLTTPKAKAGSGSAAVEETKEVETIPLESQERLTTPAQVAAIKARYGPFLGQRVITTLLSGETFRLACVRSKQRLPVPATQSAKDEHAFDWFHDWSDWVEAIERVGDHNFKSWVPHRLIMKAVKCIRERGDLWSRSSSALEMNQSDVGRTLDKCSSRRKSIDQGNERTSRPIVKMELDGQQESLGAGVEEPQMATDVSVMKVTTAMAQSAAKHFIATQAYREDQENCIQMRETRRLVLGEEGRSTKARGLTKIEKPIEGVDMTACSMTNFIEMMVSVTDS